MKLTRVPFFAKVLVMTYVDAHGHLADPRLDPYRSEMLIRARRMGIGSFVQGGVGPEDWQRQLGLQATIPELVPVFGLHPYWVHENSNPDDCERALDLLARLVPQAFAMGEMGLDFRPQYLSSQGQQLEMFARQLELARFVQKPVVLHLVRAHEEAIKILSLWELPAAGGLVHAFNGSAAKARDFLSYGLLISVGGAVCRPDNQRLHQAVKEIPLHQLLLESDTPDQAPPAVKDRDLATNIPASFSEPATILRVAETVAKIHAVSAQEVLDRTSQNARKLFSL